MDRSKRAAFPPATLMQRVSGLTNDDDFAKHGRDIFAALEGAGPKPLLEFNSILDFGIGSGRLARMFYDFKGAYTGVDVDAELVAWTNSALPWTNSIATTPHQALPFPDASFDCVISISVFTHMTEIDSAFYLRELHRVSKPGAILLLTVHGKRAAERALTEPKINDMLGVSYGEIVKANEHLSDPASGFYFAKQDVLSTALYEYGETFVSESYISREWAKLFEVNCIVGGAIHDFQDIAVVSKRG